MTLSIVDAIQQRLGYQELEKVDPNTQEAKSPRHNFAQAAIPTVLIGLYKYATTEAGAADIISGNRKSNWLDIFFGNKNEVVQRVAQYTGEDNGNVAGQMEKIANEAVAIFHENTPANTTVTDAKVYISKERSAILKRLPAELQIGDLLNDNTLDDRTNKMDGPMSNHMHFLEKLFSGGTPED